MAAPFNWYVSCWIGGMKNDHRFLVSALLVLLLLIPVGTVRGEISVKAEVLTSDATSSRVRFTFSGDLAGYAPEVNLRSFVFLDFAASPGLKNSLPAVLNLTAFEANSVNVNTSGTINKVEVRNNEPYYYDRIGFVFDQALSAQSAFSPGSSIEVVFPTTAPIATSDFAGLPVYWCFPNWGTNAGRGTLAGVTNPAVEAATISVVKAVSGGITLEFTGVLESSPDLTSGFTPVEGATSPYQVPEGGPVRLFYRASQN